MEELEEKVLCTINKFNLIENGDKLVLGVSGGPDSITMLNVLIELRKSNKIKFDMVVCHINHGLRENAKLDEEFVESFCSKKDIECFVLHADVKKEAEETKRGLEETGRDVRYKFYNEILEKTSSNKIAIAHNANDNVETVIMNIMRGSGLAGLKGIEAKSGIYIRPLIECERSEIEEYCEEKNLNPRHDESNDENIYTRNKIRNIVIPYIKENFNPNIIQTITRLSDIAKDDLNYLENETRECYKRLVISEKEEKNKKEVVLNLKEFNKLDKAIEKRVLLYAINQIFGSTKGIEKIHVEDMIKLCNNNIGNKYLTPNKNTKIVIKNKQIILSGQK